MVDISSTYSGFFTYDKLQVTPCDGTENKNKTLPAKIAIMACGIRDTTDGHVLEVECNMGGSHGVFINRRGCLARRRTQEEDARRQSREVFAFELWSRLDVCVVCRSRRPRRCRVVFRS